MNRQSPRPAVFWPYRPRSTHGAADRPGVREACEVRLDDEPARLAGPGRALQQTMDAMVRAAVGQSAAGR